MHIGIATFDSCIQFYGLGGGQAQPTMLVVPEVDQPFCPQVSSVVVPLAECRPQVRTPPFSPARILFLSCCSFLHSPPCVRACRCTCVCLSVLTVFLPSLVQCYCLVHRLCVFSPCIVGKGPIPSPPCCSSSHTSTIDRPISSSLSFKHRTPSWWGCDLGVSVLDIEHTGVIGFLYWLTTLCGVGRRRCMGPVALTHSYIHSRCCKVIKYRKAVQRQRS